MGGGRWHVLFSGASEIRVCSIPIKRKKTPPFCQFNRRPVRLIGNVSGCVISGKLRQQNITRGLQLQENMTGSYLNSDSFPPQKEFRLCQGFYFILHHEMKKCEPSKGSENKNIIYSNF